MDAIHGLSSGGTDLDNALVTRAHYSPPWADVSIIGIAGSSGSGKSTLSQAIVRQLNLPWVVIMSMVRAISDFMAGFVAYATCAHLSLSRP